MWWVIAVLALAVATFLWLRQATVREATISTQARVSLNDLLDFLCSPVNLEKCHPSIQKVTDVEETKQLVNFQIEENLGVVGNKVFPMSLEKFNNSQFSASFRFESTSDYAKVMLMFTITDSREMTPCSGDTPLSSIRLVIRVEAPRFFNFFIISHVTDVWQKTLTATKAILER